MSSVAGFKTFCWSLHGDIMYFCQESAKVICSLTKKIHNSCVYAEHSYYNFPCHLTMCKRVTYLYYQYFHPIFLEILTMNTWFNMPAKHIFPSFSYKHTFLG